MKLILLSLLWQLVSAQNQDGVAPLVKMPTSPFDNDLNLGSLESLSNNQIEESEEEPPACSRACFNEMDNAISMLFDEMSHIERFRLMCSNYDAAQKCVKDTGCDKKDLELVDAWTSGIRYICSAFNATIYCIDSQSPFVQTECEQQCQTKNFFVNYIMQTTMRQSITKGIVSAATGGENPLGSLLSLAGKDAWANGDLGPIQDLAPGDQPNSFEESMRNFKDLTGGMCRLGDCLLGCLKNKFNTRCEGSAGTLLTEMFVRPVAASQVKMSFLTPFMGMVLPEHCSNLFSGGLEKYRIEPNMDKELKRMYKQKADEEQRKLLAEQAELKKIEKENDVSRRIISDSPLDSALDVLKFPNTDVDMRRNAVNQGLRVFSDKVKVEKQSDVLTEEVDEYSGSGWSTVEEQENEVTETEISGDQILEEALTEKSQKTSVDTGSRLLEVSEESREDVETSASGTVEETIESSTYSLIDIDSSGTETTEIEEFSGTLHDEREGSSSGWVYETAEDFSGTLHDDKEGSSSGLLGETVKETIEQSGSGSFEEILESTTYVLNNGEFGVESEEIEEFSGSGCRWTTGRRNLC